MDGRPCIRAGFDRFSKDTRWQPEFRLMRCFPCQDKATFCAFSKSGQCCLMLALTQSNTCKDCRNWCYPHWRILRERLVGRQLDGHRRDVFTLERLSSGLRRAPYSAACNFHVLGWEIVTWVDFHLGSASWFESRSPTKFHHKFGCSGFCVGTCTHAAFRQRLRCCPRSRT